jgi:hypothetical protein
MPSIIEDTVSILASMNLEGVRVSTPPGYAGLQVELPNNSQAYFVWSKIDNEDFHFRLARFWENDNPFSMVVCPSLPEAIAQALVFIKQ